MTDAADAPYRIIEIRPDWVLEDEAMGSKEKFWFREDDGPEWLFKYPQPNTGQHWAEKIAAEVADVLDILHARVELAVFQGVRGSATESFAREGRELYHGNQVLAGQLLDYDPGKQFRQSDHTLESIFAALDRVFEAPDAARRARERLAEYLVLDALIGNTDRHHENWGILRKRTPSGWTGMVAPTFDHASSLGRELLDERPGKCRRRILEEDRLPQYAEKARGAIYWRSSDRKGISPLELVRRASDLHPGLFGPALNQLEKLEKDRLHQIMERIPEGWITELSKNFAVDLMCYNLEQLGRITP
ncbi:MAG: HipA domain-containing protein [Pseudomonadota bacterium]|nr:HipA domain-containing protein [Pseudomonadota bacterium]